MYKIFINEYPLVISSNENDFFAVKNNYRIVDDNEKAIANAIETLENSDKRMGNFGLMIMTENADETFKRFSSRFEKVTAAGGLVYNAANELLLIKRQGKWDLPKGKKDNGETVEDAAQREVKEECGIKKLRLLEFLTRSYHTYFLEGKRVLKITHWYEMEADEKETLKPQREENITEVSWFSFDKLDIRKLDTYNSIRSVLKIAQEKSQAKG